MIDERTVSGDARIVVGPDGSIGEATKAALALLGFSLDELRALPPGALSTMAADDRAALRGEFEASHPSAAIGRANIRRSDGSQLPVAFVLQPLGDGRWEAILHGLEQPVDQPKVALRVGDALTAWRAAERRLEELEPGSAERVDVERDIDRLRAEYRHLFDAAHPRG